MNRFRVVQFNMQFGQGWDHADPDAAPVRLDATLAEIRAHDGDIILLQEVEQALAGGTQVQPPPNFTRIRHELAGYDGCFAYPRADPRELPFGIGLAIFSRTPLRDVRQIDLPSPPIEFEFQGRRMTPTDRALLAAHTTVLGRELRLLNTHLLAFFMLGASSSDHPEQREQIARELAASAAPTILAGDFNVRRHRALVEQFAPHGFATVQDREVTWRRQPYVLDHIFYNAPLRCVARRVIPTLASDHHVLVADFEFA
ncbi:MAG TPA: endonuclease/exonuclease/phosphatase family protein [Opitutaceae bacterium]|nr:endonuclease/exonuclease/phosphatase family protein [Opitutaceae bacterium]